MLRACWAMFPQVAMPEISTAREPSMRLKPGWYVLRCQPRKEYALRGQLQRRGILAIAPREIYWVRNNDRQRRLSGGRWFTNKERPVFPSLVFARAQSAEDWQQIRQTPFVLGALSMAGEYYRLKDEDVTMLYNVDGMQQSQPVEPKQLKAGDKAKVSIGALAGHSCEIQTVAGKRAKVLLMLLGSMKTVDIPVTSLEAV